MKKHVKLFGFLLILFTLTRSVFNARVDGHSMDPNLEEGNKLVVLKYLPVDRFDVVVAKQNDHFIVKRVIGLPNETVTYKNDELFIDGKKIDEPYLNDFKKQLVSDNLRTAYSYNSFYQEIAKRTTTFTLGTNGEKEFTIKVPSNHYLLLGDNRLVSDDGRKNGTVERNQLLGEVVYNWSK